MKKIIFCMLLMLSSFTMLFAFTEEQLELAHNPEFALYQRLQLDTVIARKNSNNRVVLSELALRDLVPTMNVSTKNYYTSFNQSLASLELLDVQRERLDYLHEEKKKSNLTALVPNAVSVATVAITTGLSNPLGAIIGIVGSAISSAASYIDAKNQENLEYIQNKWELDDQQKQVLVNLGTILYGYKCEIAESQGIPTELTLSTKDLEDFVDFCNEPDYSYRLIRLLSMDQRLEILPDYWMELALASYGLRDFEQTLEYIDKFEEIYYPVIYHDSDYAYLLMVKSDCISQLYGNDKYDELENICEKLLNNIESNDWEKKFYVLSLYMEIYRNSSNHQIAEKAYELFPAVLSELIDDYKEDTTSYLAGEYSKQGLSQIQIDIDSAEVEVTSAANNIAAYEEKQIKNGKKEKVYKKEAAYIILQDKLAKAEEKLNNLKDNYSEFERTSKLMVPPSSDFVCLLIKEYIELTKMLGYTDSVIFRSICTSFFESVSQNSTVWNEFKEYNFDLLPEPSSEVRYRHEVHDKFVFWGGVTSAIFEIPLSLINSTAAYSESIISTEDIAAFIVIDDFFQFPLIAEDLSIELGEKIDESFLKISFPLPSSFDLQKEKPEKDVRNDIEFKVVVFSSFFDPITIVLQKDSELVEECIKRVDYAAK